MLCCYMYRSTVFEPEFLALADCANCRQCYISHIKIQILSFVGVNENVKSNKGNIGWGIFHNSILQPLYFYSNRITYILVMIHLPFCPWKSAVFTLKYTTILTQHSPSCILPLFTMFKKYISHYFIIKNKLNICNWKNDRQCYSVHCCLSS